MVPSQVYLTAHLDLTECQFRIKNSQANSCLTKEDRGGGERWGVFNKRSGAAVEFPELEWSNMSLQETFDICTPLLGSLFK